MPTSRTMSAGRTIRWRSKCGIAEWLAVTTEMITSGVPGDEGDRALAGSSVR